MTRRHSPPPLLRFVSAEGLRRCGLLLAMLAGLVASGCGRIVAQKATEQLLASDAVDRSVSQVDFQVLAGRKVFLDTQYVNKTVPGVGYVTAEYIISAIRQKMMGDGCLMQDKLDEADFVVEMRIGTLGADGHEVIYGLPANNFLGIAASVVATPPAATQNLPTVPEISLAKRNDQMAAAKIGLFAYNRKTKDPIWQSGLTEARSNVDDRWYFGAGPYHRGNIHTPKSKKEPPKKSWWATDATVVTEPDNPAYFVERRFADPGRTLQAEKDAAEATKLAADAKDKKPEAQAADAKAPKTAGQAAAKPADDKPKPTADAAKPKDSSVSHDRQDAPPKGQPVSLLDRLRKRVAEPAAEAEPDWTLSQSSP